MGLCWSGNADIARMFGSGLNAVNAGGVLLKCCASEAAIIAGPGDHSRNLGENEFTLDPSKVSGIEAIDQFPAW